LIPPWAHTEWDRFTGTTENTLTEAPSSASFIVAANPAKPPPTTITSNGDDAIPKYPGSVRYHRKSVFFDLLSIKCQER
jgi:hypothetical protein